MNEPTASLSTAFEESATVLGELVRKTEIDFAALTQKISRCDLAECHGVCCHDGVFLGRDEATLIPDLVETHSAVFDTLGLDLPGQVVIDGSWRDRISGPKTAVRFEPMSERVEDYPAHFPDTACVFLAEDGCCGLQVLSEELGRHPWHYKPATCWIHPLAIMQRNARPPLLTLHNRETDPQNLPDYDGFVSRTHCGRVVECGEPAFEVLAEELAMLGRLGGRDLLGEIGIHRGEPANPPDPRFQAP